MNTRIILQSLLRTSMFRMGYQVFYLILIKLWLKEEEASMVIGALVPLVGYAFFAKSGFNTILAGIKEMDIKTKIAFSDVLFFVFYFIYIKIIDSHLNSVILVLSFIQYRILIRADINLATGNMKYYTRLNNIFYVLLFLYIIVFISVDFQVENHLAVVIILSLLISLVSLLHGKFKFDKNIAIVQSGGVVSLSLGTVHSTKLEGEELVNFTLGKAIGELPFNYLGYHLSNLLHTGYVSFTSKTGELLLFATSLLVGLVLTYFYFSNVDMPLFSKSYIIISIGYMCLFPLQYVNTYFTRRLHRANLILEGTIIQLLTNGVSILILGSIFSSWDLFIVYAMTFSLGSSMAYIMLSQKKFSSEE